MIKIKKRVGVFMVCVLFSCLSFTTFAKEQEKIYIHKDVNDVSIEYYLDDAGMPYNYVNGEKIYLALPLEHLKVEDNDLLEELNSIFDNNDNINRAAPTQYVDLSTGSGLTSSPIYTKNISFTSGNVHPTDYLKFNAQHAQVRFKTTNIEKSSIFIGDKITFYFYYYCEALDEWYSTSMTDIDCSGINGVGIQFSPSVNQYGKFTIVKSSDWDSATINIWTIPVW